MKGMKSTLIVMSTEQFTELVNHCTVHMKLTEHCMLIIPELIFLKLL